jgi:RHS repeat-associated protein
LWEGARLLAEYNASGTRQALHGYIRDNFTPTVFQDANGTYHVHGDNLESPRILTNSSAAVVWRAKYEAFGKTVVESDPDGNSVAVTFNPRFRGQYFDAESGAHYNRYRNYDPAIGRYLESDPKGLRGGINIYAYAANNPLRFSDPLGLAIYKWPPNNYGDIPPPGGGCEVAIVKNGYIVGWKPCDWSQPDCPPAESPPPGTDDGASGSNDPPGPPPADDGESDTPGTGPRSADPPIPPWSSPQECLYHCGRERLSETWHHLALVDGGIFLGLQVLEHVGILGAGAGAAIGVPVAAAGIALAGGYALGSLLYCGYDCQQY